MNGLYSAFSAIFKTENKTIKYKNNNNNNKRKTQNTKNAKPNKLIIVIVD